MHLRLRRQTRVRAGSRYSSYLSACCFPFFFVFFFWFFYAHGDPVEYRVPRSFRVLPWSLSLSLSFFQPSPLFLLFVFFFTKITEQHQHLFLLKSTPSSARRPTKTEADHFLFLSFIRMYAHKHTYTHSHMHSTHIQSMYTPSRSHKCARARFSIAVSLTFGKMDALRFAPVLYFFVLLNIFFLFFSYMKRIINRTF